MTLANRVRELTLTVGIGDITLGGALVAHIGFADAFAVGDVVAYVIEDGDNYEIGSGTLSAADTLERTNVGETLVGGVYDKATPTAIALSGNALVFCAVTSEFLLDPTTRADVISEVTPGAGVLVDGVLLKDGTITSAGEVGIGGTAITRLHAQSVSGTNQIRSSVDGVLAADIAEIGISSGIRTWLMRTVGNDGAWILRDSTGAVDLLNIAPTSGNATFAGSITGNNGALLTGAATANARFTFTQTTAGLSGQIQQGSSGFSLSALGAQSMLFDTNGVTALTIDSSQSATFAGRIFAENHIARSINTDVLIVSGGNSAAVGANSVMYGQGHATRANDMELRANITPWLSWDDSANTATFAGDVVMKNLRVQDDNVDTSIIISATSLFDPRLDFAQNGIGSMARLSYDESASDFSIQNLRTGSNADINLVTADFGTALTIKGNGNLEVNGTSTFAGSVTTQATGTASAVLSLDNNGTSGRQYDIGSSSTGYGSAGKFYIYDVTAGAERFSIDLNGDAIFAGNITMSGTDLSRNVDNSSWSVSGGTIGSGMILTLTGGTHATQPSELIIKDGTTRKLSYASDVWDFQGTTVQGLGDLILSGGSGNQISRDIDTDTLLLSGGTASNVGSNIALFGGAHATEASDIRVRSGGTEILRWDDSANLWDFQGNALMGVNGIIISSDIGVVRDIATASLSLSGGTTNGDGGFIALRGPSHSTQANDILLGVGAVPKLQWDNSASVWDFQGNDITTSGFINHGSPTELTISAGVITATGSFHTVDTEADAATDDLDTINGGSEGDRLILMAANSARTIVLKDGTGNLALNADFPLDNGQDTLELVYAGTLWRELSRSNNG